MTLPNFLYLGPDKAGSTWLHEGLIRHPQVYLSPAKDLYFFDRYFDRGTDWYESQFKGAGPQHRVVGEITQDYLSDPQAPQRIKDTLAPDVKLMATMRDPVSRAFSSWLYARRFGLWADTFSEALKEQPELIEHGRYGAQLRRYQELFPKENIHITVFDDLKADPQAFFDDVTDFLALDRMGLSEEIASVRLPASKARFVPLTFAVRKAADVVRRLDGANAVARVKRSPLVQRFLYTPLGDAKPTVPEADAAMIRDTLREDVRMVEQDFGLDLVDRWGW